MEIHESPLTLKQFHYHVYTRINRATTLIRSSSLLIDRHYNEATEKSQPRNLVAMAVIRLKLQLTVGNDSVQFKSVKTEPFKKFESNHENI